MTEIVDSIVVKVVADVDGAQRRISAYGGSVEQAFGRVEGAAARGGAEVARSTSSQRAAYRELAGQLSKAAIDITGGADAFAVLGQQGTAVASTIEKFGGTVGRVAGFITGPWGIALTTVASIIGTLTTRTGEAEGATRRKGEAARNLTEALDDLDAASGRNNKSQAETIRLALLAARAFRDKELSVRNATSALLQNALEEQRILRIRAQAPGQRGENASVGLEQARQAVLSLEARLAEHERKLADADVRIRGAEATNIVADVEGRLDPALAAMQRFDRRLAVLRAQFEAKKRDRASFDREVEKAARSRDAAIDAADRTRPGSTPSLASIDRTSHGISTGSGSENRELTPAQLRAGVGDPSEDIAAVISVDLVPTPSSEQLFALFANEAPLDVSKLEAIDPEQMAKISRIGGELTENLSSGLADAIANGKSLGDVLVDSFARAGQALIQAKILQLLDPAGDGSAGFVKGATDIFGTIFRARTPARRASGGHVSAGELYRVNEAGIEGFRPAGSGKIIPLGQMAARPGGGGVTVVQPLNVSFAGAITTPELMAQFKAYADSVGQAAAIGGAAMAQTRIARRAARALPR